MTRPKDGPSLLDVAIIVLSPALVLLHLLICAVGAGVMIWWGKDDGEA